MRFLQRLTQQLTQVWLGMSVPRRVSLVVLAALCLAAVIGVGYWAAQPDYQVLYSGLAPEEAGAMTAKLQSQGVVFRLAAGGTTILVPAEQVQQLKVDLAVEGLPAKGGKGFEMFDPNALGMTPFMQHVNYGRALQAELAKTIMSLEPVAFARVHVVQPEPSPFIRDAKPTTASVVLKLKPGMALNRNVAAGIVALVSRAVEGLTPEQVTLLDTAGHVLFDQRGKEGGAVPASQLEYRRDYESYLAAKAEEMLAQLFGPGRAVVRITAEINFKSLTETKETYDLEQKAVKKETINNKKSNSGAAAARGVAGAASNVGRAAAVAPAPEPGRTEVQEDSDIEYYQPPKTLQQRVEGAGGVERLTIAAMVDREAAPGTSLAEAQEIIKQAVGYKAGRDEIKVSDVKMPAPPAMTDLEQEWLTTQRQQRYLQIARAASLGVASLVALVVGWFAWRRMRSVLAPKPAEPAEQDDQARLLQTFNTVAQRDPEVLARLLASWLEDPKPTTKAAA